MFESHFVYEELGHEVAVAHLDHQIDPTEKLAEVAARQNLNPNQVQRVAEEANQAILEDLRKNANADEDRTFEFPLANPEDVVGRLRNVKVADSGFVSVDVRSAPKTSSLGTLIDPPATDMQKLAATTARAQIYIEEEQMAEQAKEADIREGIESFVKIAREMVLEDDWTLDELAYVLRQARPKHASIVDGLVTLTKRRFQAMGVKVAAPAPEHLFSKTLMQSGRPARVINGEHSIVLTIDTLVPQDPSHGTPAGPSVDDAKRYVVSALRNISGRITPVS